MRGRNHNTGRRGACSAASAVLLGLLASSGCDTPQPTAARDRVRGPDYVRGVDTLIPTRTPTPTPPPLPSQRALPSQRPIPGLESPAESTPTPEPTPTGPPVGVPEEVLLAWSFSPAGGLRLPVARRLRLERRIGAEDALVRDPRFPPGCQDLGCWGWTVERVADRWEVTDSGPMEALDLDAQGELEGTWHPLFGTSEPEPPSPQDGAAATSPEDDLAAIAAALAGNRSFSPSQSRVEVSGDRALVLHTRLPPGCGEWSVAEPDPDGCFAWVLQRSGGGWVVTQSGGPTRLDLSPLPPELGQSMGPLAPANGPN